MAAVRVWIISWLLVAGSGAAQPDAGSRVDRSNALQTYAGLTLEEALLALSEQGLELIFTERLVRPDMEIEHEPVGADGREVLIQLLRPHGLTIREGVGGVLVVVPAELEVSAVRGTVREWQSDRALGKVEVRIAGTDHQAVTSADGAFRIDGVAAGSHFLQANRAGFMVLQAEILVRAGEATDVILELRPMPLTVEEIDVHANRAGLLGEKISTLRLDRQELLGLPRLGEDVLRPVTMLPGTAGNDVSARFHVRGGRADEVMIRLDGFEILEPYHLQDFNSALGIVSPDVVGEAELLTGAFPVQYGDRMSGVLDLSSREPSWQRRTELGLSILFAEASSSGTLSDDRGHWLAALRTGSLEPVAKLAKEEENPGFSDVFGKIARTLGPGRSLRGNFLMSEDRLDFTEILDEAEPDEEDLQRVRFRTTYVNGYGWISHQAVFGRDLYVESKASLSRVERDRQGNELTETGSFMLADERRLEAGAAAQDFSARITSRHELKWGFEARALDVDFDYLNERDLTDPLAVIGHRPPEDTIRFDQRFRGQQYAAYLSDRVRPTPRLTVELGLRYDKNTVLDDSDVSPRLSLDVQLRPRSRLTLAWGLFHQSQRLYELQIEDGETRFFPSEKSEHRILGFKHTFGDPKGTKRRPPALRIELYEHRISDPRPRFENLYDPLSLAPEVEPDRVKVAPESSRARGLEIFVTGGSRRFDWFASYANSRIEDRIAGSSVDRGIDQPHALKLGIAFRIASPRRGANGPQQWDLSLTQEIHTGWPTTQLDGVQVAGEDDEVEILPLLGPLYGDRLPTYHRLDLRASRRFPLRRGELEFFLDVQNVTNATNVRGFDVSLEASDDEAQVEKNRKLWAGFAPSFGIRWAF